MQQQGPNSSEQSCTLEWMIGTCVRVRTTRDPGQEDRLGADTFFFLQRLTEAACSKDAVPFGCTTSKAAKSAF